ncbi:chromosomal replication initiator protein [Thioclava sp. ES.031]|uniref:Chromosomal replication initiator protein DnaA n=1 Tax=Thioclava electrotropha TaxID=1549850 RepID=A0ABX6YYK3_9RHOB|nr:MULTISPECIES: chromosomal replication initiator protein DnaA [Thioclava]MPQ95653.1 chromosomal replication initiator protein DnaA [Thioclava sp. JE_KL1]OOY04905.1 chromosomal replication initiation protein DnaA [Thioclava sp. F28-4]OOY18961.1 chromosomal replication initiation protein DnaA [Thioclava sp. DLFJ5-1]PFG65054.1 chromosomal replication initiator protein [Thioclava sp. ES.031]QPZ92828.1 chromosomal replication initiator protein DnaA [Thioclava electrotropha]
MTDDTWGQVCNELQKAVGQNNYTTWIAPLELIDLEDGIASFQAPTKFMCDWVSRNFAEPILSELRRAGVSAERVNISVPSRRPMNGSANGATRPTVPAPAPAAPVAKPRKTPRPDEPLPGAPLDSRFTFDSFVVGKPNELAHAAAKRVAEGGPVTFNPLFLYGGVGLGKTHLMHAIAHDLQHQRPDLRVLYLSAEQFMYRFVQALREKQIMDFKEMFRSIDVLMVDDVQFIAGKDSTQEEFFHTFNALVDQGKQIVISADRAPGEIKDLEERIKSRLSCGLVVDLHPTDYELRLGILQTKTEAYKSEYPDLKIAPGVLEFVAHRITSNVRILEGALTRLFAYGSLIGREITMDLAQECLKDQLRQSERKVTVEEIQRKVAEHYNVRLSDLVGPKRLRAIARPRQVAMFLAKSLTTRSLPDIGRRFGGRDHTTIMHGIRKIEELRGTDSQLAEDIELLRRLLES